MKNFILIILLGALLLPSSFAQESIGKQEIRKAAQQFIAAHFQAEANIIEMRMYNENPHISLLLLEPSGYLLMSTKKNTQAVLAWSEHSKADFVRIPPAFKAWTNQYEKQLDYLENNPAASLKNASAQWDALLSGNTLSRENMRAVEPMLFSTWDQGFPYNMQCPADPEGPSGHCVTGCVATALGQLVNYFRFPQTGEGEYAYYLYPYGTISADFWATTYHWDQMNNHPTEKNPAIAQLLSHLGISVDMQYGPNSSGMNNHKGAYTLRTFFRYSPETEYLFRDSTSLDWKAMLVQHLDQNIPLYYAGWSEPNVVGHAFICDGYQTEDYYHFNWGWGSSWDGYFYVDDLVVGGNNFNLAQEIIINAFPDTVNNEYPYWPENENIITAFSGSLDDGSGPVYPSKEGMDVKWLIDPQNEFDSVSSIHLSFHKFDIEENVAHLKIYDGEDTNAPLLAELTGDLGTALPQISSTGNKMLLHYTTSTSTSCKGWLLSYESERPEWCRSMEMINENAGTISDGSQNFFYENNTLCKWNINMNSPFGMIDFMYFETEEGHDVVKVYEFPSMELLAELSGDYSGQQTPGPFYTTTGSFFITWQTNNTNRAQGWKAEYSNLDGTNDLPIEKGMRVYPNPGNGAFYLSNLRNISKLEVYNIAGQLILEQQPNKNMAPYKIDLSNQTKGVYFLKIIQDEKSIMKKLILK